MAMNDRDQSRATDERRTVELCAHEQDGVRCILRRGHDGKHQAMVIGKNTRRWG